MTIALMTPVTFVTRRVGDTGNPLTAQFIGNDLQPKSLVDIDMSLVTCRLMNTINHVARDGKGSWEALDRAKGIAWYRWHADDVANEGPFLLEATVPFTDPLTFGPVAIDFVARI